MRLKAALSLLFAVSALPIAAEQPSQPGTAAAVSEATEFWLTWDAQNSRATFAKAKKEILESSLTIDPENSRIAKFDGKGRFIGALPLPDRKHWRAFHVTSEGIAELSFPVRLRWVHANEGLPETIRIQSIDPDQRVSNDFTYFAMDFSPQSARPGGYRSVPTTETFRFPEADSDANDSNNRRSMLLDVDDDTLKYNDTITVGRTVLAVAQDK